MEVDVTLVEEDAGWTPRLAGSRQTRLPPATV